MRKQKGEILCEQHQRSEIERLKRSYPKTIGKRIDKHLDKGENILVTVIYVKDHNSDKPILRCSKDGKFTIVVNNS